MANYMNYIGLNLVWAVLILYHGFICTIKAQEAIYMKSDTYTEPRNLLFFSYSVSDADCFAICSATEACSMITIEFLDDQKSYICQHYEGDKNGNEINTINEMEIWYKTESSHLSDPPIGTESDLRTSTASLSSSVSAITVEFSVDDMVGMSWSDAREHCRQLPDGPYDLAVFDNTEASIVYCLGLDFGTFA